MILFISLLLLAQENPETLLLKAGKVYTVSHGTIEGAQVLIRGDRIVEVGRKIAVPKGTRVLDFGARASLTPGWIDLHSHLGSSFDADETTEAATPQVRAIDAFASLSPQVRRAVSSGVTMIALAPGNRNVIGGQVSLLRWAGSRLDRMEFRRGIGLKVSLTGEALFPDREPTSVTGALRLLRGHLRNREGEAAQVLFRRKGIAFLHARTADEILRAAELTKEFGLRTVLLHGDEAGRVMKEVRDSGLPFAVGPLRVFDPRAKLELPAALARSGIRFAFVSDAPATPESYLRVSAALAVKHGLDRTAALRALTLTAAELLGVSDAVGSLEPKKLADIVAYAGDPLGLNTPISAVIVGGRIVYRAKKR